MSELHRTHCHGTCTWRYLSPLPLFPGTTGIVYKHLLWLLPLYRHFHLQRHELLPSMAAIIMRQQQEVRPLGLFFRWFNGAFDWFKAGYIKIVEFLIRIRLLVIPIFIAGLVATG